MTFKYKGRKLELDKDVLETFEKYMGPITEATFDWYLKCEFGKNNDAIIASLTDKEIAHIVQHYMLIDLKSEVDAYFLWKKEGVR